MLMRRALGNLNEGREGCGGTNLNPIFRSASPVQTDAMLARRAKCLGRRAWPDTSPSDLWESPAAVVSPQICPRATLPDARNPKRGFKEPKRPSYRR